MRSWMQQNALRRPGAGTHQPSRAMRTARENPEVELPEKYAVVCLVFKGDYVLSVTRGTDLLNLGLPGGTIEEDESVLEAALRELKEETGLEGCPETSKEIQCVYHGNTLVSVVRVSKWAGDLAEGPEGVPAWALRYQFLEPTCKYAETNRRIFAKVKQERSMQEGFARMAQRTLERQREQDQCTLPPTETSARVSTCFREPLPPPHKRRKCDLEDEL